VYCAPGLTPVIPVIVIVAVFPGSTVVGRVVTFAPPVHLPTPTSSISVIWAGLLPTFFTDTVKVAVEAVEL